MAPQKRSQLHTYTTAGLYNNELVAVTNKGGVTERVRALTLA